MFQIALAARAHVRRLATCLIAVSLICGCGRSQFDGERAFALLERQCEFGPRPPGSAAHVEAAEWLSLTLSELADEVAVQRFVAQSRTGDVELTNIIASFRPDSRERVLLAAHWDTRAVAEKDPDPAERETPILGANDGASGVAVLLELARLMADDPPAVGVDIVLFDGEDGGDEGGLPGWCLGSTYYAARMGSYCPQYAVVVDMIGDRDLSIPREPNSWQANPEAVERVWSAARRAGSRSFEDAFGQAMYDDHVPLILAGVPSVLVIDASYEYWHTIGDTPDKCSPRSLEEVGRALEELVY